MGETADTAVSDEGFQGETDLAASQDIGTETADPSAASQYFTVKVGGEDVQVSLDEALNGYMRQSDYTQKTQALAEQRDSLTYAEEIRNALEQDPERAIQALQVAYLGAQEPQMMRPEPQVQDTEADWQDPDEAFRSRVEEFMQQQEMRTFEQKVELELQAMHQQFGQFDDLQVLQYAVERGIPSVTEAAKAFVVDRVLAQAQRQQAQQQAQQRKASAPPVAGGRGVAGGTVQPGGVTAPTSVRDALALAEQAHGMTL